jgi:argininosuccinate synthase
MKKKVVLAYSGGLDTSVILRWLIEEQSADVIAFIGDVGQGEDLEEIKKRAIDTGAKKVYIVDLKREFVKDFVFQAIRFGAIYERRYLMGTALARPILAKAQVEVAKKENADALSHGATGKGNDQVRFELTYKALAPELEIIPVWRIWKFSSRSELIDYAKEKKIPITITKEKPYSIDRNLMHTSYEGGILENLNNFLPDDVYMMTVSPKEAPDREEEVSITFKQGFPIAINDKEYPPEELLSLLNEIAGRNGIGRVDIVENRFVGIKSRGVYEAPGATLLHFAHLELETLTIDRDLFHYKEKLAYEFSLLVYNGFWFSRKLQSLLAFLDKTQENVSGTIALKLYKGNIFVSGRYPQKSLYKEDMATFEGGKLYDQKDANGFIKLISLPISIYHL